MIMQSACLIYILLCLSLLTNANTSNIGLRKLDNEGIIKAEFQMVTKNKFMIILVGMGVPEQKINLVVDIGSDRTWVDSSVFSPQTSSHYVAGPQTERKNHDEFNCIGVVSTDTISFESVSMNQFDFLFVDKIEGNAEIFGALSLGREYDSKQFSLVYRLSASTKTFFNSFSLKFDDQENKGTLYIGDLIPELQDEAYLMDTCELVNINPKIKWGCILTHAFIGSLGSDIKIEPDQKSKIYSISQKKNKVTQINSPAFFETIYNKIYVPMNFIDYLIQNYFVESENNNIPLCKKEFNEQEKVTSFVCSSLEITKLENLNLVFGSNLDLFLNSNDLFICIEDQCEFLIYNKDNINHWAIGLPLLKNYHTIFDYNTPILTFHGKDKKAKVEMASSGGSNIFKGVVIFIICVVLLVLITLGVIYVLRRKNVNRKQIQNQIYEQFNASSL